MNRRVRRRRVRLAAAGFGIATAVLLIGLWVGGHLLSSRRVERVSAILPATPEMVWALLTDLDGMPAWRHDLASLERLPNRSGRVRWREVSAGGARAALERTEAVAPVLMVVSPAGLENPERRWTYRLAVVDGGTELVIELERQVGNPVRRVLVAISGGERARMGRFVADIERRLFGRRRHLASGGASGR